MGREDSLNYIKNKIIELAYKVEVCGRLNLLDTNNRCETFYCLLFNMIFDYSLKNANTSKSNFESIDLIDESHKIVVQVSSRGDKKKINESLSKDFIKNHRNYTFKFICIVNNKNLRKPRDYSNPYGILFNPEKDFFDVKNVLEVIEKLDMEKVTSVYSFVKKELSLINDDCLHSDLAAVINILSSEKLNDTGIIINNSFEIDQKIEFNGLNSYSDLFYEYVSYYKVLNDIYETYSESDEDIERTTLLIIKTIYLQNKTRFDCPEELLNFIFEDIRTRVVNGSNFKRTNISEERLNICIFIILTDAFIKCKIFENPKGYRYAIG